MRLFIAVLFEEDILNSLTAFQDRLRIQGVRGRYARRENLHLTLAFIGDYGDPEDVLDAMARADFRPFDLELDGVGSFGSIFWAGLKDSIPLAACTRRLRRTLADQGIPFDRKKFSPHITLIRDASYRNGRPIPVTDPPAGRMIVKRISLMKSERGRNGMIYTEIGSVEAAG